MSTTTQKKPLTKTQLLSQLADETGLTKKQVGEVLNALSGVIEQEVGGRKGAGAISIPGLVKIKKVRKPAVKGGQQKTNPFTGEPMVTKSKPARNVVKVLPLKALKDMV